MQQMFDFPSIKPKPTRNKAVHVCEGECACCISAGVCKKQLFIRACVCVVNSSHYTLKPYKAEATGLLLARRRINAFRTQCQCNVFVYSSSESLAPPEHPDRQTPTSPCLPPPPPPQLCLFIIDQGVAALPEGLRHGNFSSPPSHFFLAPSLSPSLSSSPLVCSGSQCTSSNIVPTSWQSCAICTPCQGSCCHGYWQAPENKNEPRRCHSASPLLLVLFFFHQKNRNTCEVVVLCCVYAYMFFFSPLDARGPEEYKLHSCVQQQQ